MRRLVIAVALLATCLCGTAANAHAAPGDPWEYKFSFSGETLPSPLVAPSKVVVNHQTGNVLVLDRGVIDQFDAEGHPVDFAGLGSPQLTVGENGRLAIDNSGGPSQGDFYLFNFGYVHAYQADGTPTGEGIFGPGWFWPGIEGTLAGDPVGGGVGPDGGLWLITGDKRAVKTTPALVSTGQEVSLPFPGAEQPPYQSTEVIFHGGDVYVTTDEIRPDGTAPLRVHRFDAENGFADLGDTGLLSDNFHYRAFGIDPATGEAYMLTEDHRPTGTDVKLMAVPTNHVPPAPGTPYEALGGLAAPADETFEMGFDFDATGQTLYVTAGGEIEVFHREPPSPPRDLAPLEVLQVRSRGVVLKSSLISGGLPVTYHFEFGTDTSYGSSTELTSMPYTHFEAPVRGSLAGLQPGTTYHVRLAATTSAGTTYGADTVFTTYAIPPGGVDPCPNALARKQTGARTLPDCRAYELASAADTGGYDVESYLAPGQTSFPGYPQAPGRLLYSTYSGAVPGPWNATNKGPDPYLAVRGEDGWRTDYVGLPADLSPAAGSFSSVLGEADAKLDSFAFAGAGLCSPCFGSGLETGIPVRLPNGQLVQGMAGSLDPGVASARPEGKVARYFSSDGRHLVFASKYAFEPGANNNGSDLTVYDRDLVAGTTEIASTDSSGATLAGPGISELGMSDDGSRILVGQRLGTDSAGNEYVHPYLHLASSPRSVDLAPGTTHGVLFAGMSADGGKVFFTTVDQLLPADSDSSADLYEAAVDAAGNLGLRLVTNSSSDACNPVANSDGPHWNSTGAAAGCDAVAIGGGGGVASRTGAVYFLSPEQLDGGAGTADQPNLYRAEPEQAPTFVATLEPDSSLVRDSVQAAGERKTGDFQTTGDGRFAAFGSALPLSGVATHGFVSVFRYDAAADRLDCASCETTGTTEEGIPAPAELAPNGLSLVEDGRVFFSTKAMLVLNDPNSREDVYEWSGAGPQLISGGNGPFDSALLTVSADGTDAFFFTHDTLAPAEDGNGALMKIYDARVDGGFFALPGDVPCAAADECHGPGTVAPSPPDIKSSGQTTRGNVLICRKHQVKRGGRCVKKTKKKHKHATKHASKHRHGKAKRGKGNRHA
ncbi:MAG TPA: fibronectin type III domain-containing protein [Solirubrobacterales bacterium]|jgi:hypothetical protein|nr:fibronectin type III domain-containing protein [Solirubrobacterales bacterium]